MKNLLSFNEFVNEHYNVDEASDDTTRFDPKEEKDTDPTVPPIKSTEELVPGTEYVVDGNTDMIYQGVTAGVYTFNGADEAKPATFTEEEMAALVSGGKVSAVKGL